jgi:acetyl-CoA synthetase
MLARPALYAYEEACAAQSRQVPERYNIAADVCDKHPRDKLAMIHEDPEGAVREIDGVSCRTCPTASRRC